MSDVALPSCPCELCRADPAHPYAAHHQQLRAVLERLDEQQRRWVAALEATHLGYGGTRLVAQITDLDEKTIRRGRRELGAGLLGLDPVRVRKPGAGRKPVEKSLPVSSSG